MANAAFEFRVKYAEEAARALKQVEKDVRKGLVPEMRAAAEPARSKAQELADAEISNIGATWDRMRIGVTARSVYLAPKTRRTDGSPRPNLAVLLLTRAMRPAVESTQAEIVRAVELFVDREINRAGF